MVGWQTRGGFASPVRKKKKSVCTAAYTIDPSFRSPYYYHQILAGALLYTVAAVPLQIAFIEPPNFSFYLVLDSVVEALFWFDMLLRFRLGFRLPASAIRDGDGDLRRLELNPTAIARRYLRTWFVIDLLGVLPYAPVLNAALAAPLAAAPSHVRPLARLAYAPRLLRLLRLPRVNHAVRARAPTLAPPRARATHT